MTKGAVKYLGLKQFIAKNYKIVIGQVCTLVKGHELVVVLDCKPTRGLLYNFTLCKDERT